MKNFRMWKTAALFSANFLFFVLIASLGDFHFSVNDDVQMALIANGVFGGHPDCHLVFQNALWGKFLANLYCLTSSVEWYSLALVVAHLISSTIIVYFIVKNRKNNILLISSLICFYAIWAVTIKAFQFTTTAGLLCIAGCLLISTQAYFGAFLLILVSSFIRDQSALLVLSIFIPIAILHYKKKYTKYLYIIGAFLMVFSVKQLDRLFYNTNEWKYYYQYNSARGKINDNLNLDAISDTQLQQIGIEREDLNLLEQFRPNPEIITLSVLQNLNQYLRDVPIRYKLKNLKQLLDYKILLLIWLIFAALSIFSVENIPERCIFACSHGIALLLLGWVSLDFSLKHRAFLCAFLPVIVFSMTIPNISFRSWWKTYATCVCFLAISLLYGHYYNRAKQSQEQINIVWQEQRELLQLLPVNSYVFSPAQPPIKVEGISPFHIKDYCPKLYPSGWETNIPLCFDVGYSHRCLLNENVYLFTAYDDAYIKIANYLKSRYDISISVKQIKHSEHYSITQITTI